MQDGLQNRQQHGVRGEIWTKRSHFPRIIVLFFLSVLLVVIFCLGPSYTANHAGNSFNSCGSVFLVGGQKVLFPGGRKNEHPALAGAAGPLEPPTAAEQEQQNREHTALPEITAQILKKPLPIRKQAGEGKAVKNGPDHAGNEGTAFTSPESGLAEHDYSKPVPARDVAAAGEYFAEAVFIGDSRTDGFRLFSGPPAATYYTSNGLKVDTIFTKEVVENGSEEKITIIAALRQKPFQKVYIMLGINELGWAYSELFIQKYGEVIAAIKNNAPQAQIYVQSLLPVSQKRSLSDKIYNNVKIGEYNELIQQMAAEQKIYYLDVAQCVVDAEGNLAADASTDGIHLQKKYCDLWFDYLKWHYVPPAGDS